MPLTCVFCGTEFDPEEVSYVSTDEGVYHNPECWVLHLQKCVDTLEKRVRELEEEIDELRDDRQRSMRVADYDY